MGGVDTLFAIGRDSDKVYRQSVLPEKGVVWELITDAFGL